MSNPLFQRTNNQIYFYQNDHLDTPQRLISIYGVVVWHTQYSAFGKADIQIAEVENNLRFPGQYFDVETGLHQNGFRDYDSGTGRYLERDPLGLMAGLNTYGYVKNNPVGQIDPKGKSIVVVAVVTEVVLGGSLLMYADCVDKCQKQVQKRDGDSCTPGKATGECANKCRGFIELITAPRSVEDAAVEAGKSSGGAVGEILY